MADIAASGAGFRVVDGIQADQLTSVAAEDIADGAAVRIDPTTGHYTAANATTAAEADVFGIAPKGQKAGHPLTAYRKTLLEGYDLSGMDYGADVFLSNTDETLGDVAGTVSVVVGKVAPVNVSGKPADKLLFVEVK